MARLQLLSLLLLLQYARVQNIALSRQVATLKLSLARQLKDDAPVIHALKGFEAERKPVAGYYTLMSRALTPVFQSSSKIIGVLRDAFMGVSCRLPGIRNWMGWTLVGRGRLPW